MVKHSCFLCHDYWNKLYYYCRYAGPFSYLSAIRGYENLCYPGTCPKAAIAVFAFFPSHCHFAALSLASGIITSWWNHKTEQLSFQKATNFTQRCYISLYSPIEVSYKPQTWNTTLLKILSSGLVRITFFPLHRRVLNQEPHRSCPSDRVPRGRVTRFSALQRFQRNFFGKISFNESDGVATQTVFMLAIIFRYHWYKTVLNTC